MPNWPDERTRAIGTTSIDGLDVSVAPHLLPDNGLQVSYNGWTDKDGEWSVAKRPEQLYSGSSIVAYEAGRMNGADHHVWIDGTTLYDNGASVGTVAGADSSTDIKSVDDGFVIVGADKNYIYDGTYLRELGAWQAGYIDIHSSYGAGTQSANITAITLADPCVVTLNSNPFVVGDRVYISGITGTTELNTNFYTVTASTRGAGGTITLNVSSTTFTAWSANGTVESEADLAGDYKVYIVPCIRLSSGEVLTGRPRGLTFREANDLPQAGFFVKTPTDGYDGDTITLTSGDGLNLCEENAGDFNTGKLYFEYDSTSLFSITGTAGSDYYRGARIYRTKANGYRAYLEREYFEGDDYVETFDTGTASGIELPFMSLGVPDRELGALLTYDYDEHTNAAQSECFAYAGGRGWTASSKTVYPSTLDGIGYYSDTGTIPLADTVTALGSWRDYCVAFSADRMWAIRFVGGLPDIENIPTPVGTTYQKPIIETGAGLLFLRDDGLWLFNGGEPTKVSRRGFSELYQPSGLAVAGDVIYVSGSDTAYVAIDRGDRWVWHESGHVMASPSQTSGVLYGSDGRKVSRLFTGSRTEGRLKTKLWGKFDHDVTYKVEVDMSGDVIPSVWINGNAVSDSNEHQLTENYHWSGRRVLEGYLPRLRNQYVEVEFEVMGNATINGVRLFKDN